MRLTGQIPDPARRDAERSARNAALWVFRIAQTCIRDCGMLSETEAAGCQKGPLARSTGRDWQHGGSEPLEQTEGSIASEILASS
jgi:hypothetical protein